MQLIFFLLFIINIVHEFIFYFKTNRYDFLPTVLDRSQVDAWYKSVDRDSFQMARKLINREGLLCGGSCGSAMYCAIESIKKFNIGEGQNVVVLLPDSIRNYM